MLNSKDLAALIRPVVRPRWLTQSRRPVVGSILSGVYSQAGLVITGVLVARALGPTDRGHIAFFLLLESVVRQVGSLGLPAAMTFFIARNKDHAYDVVRTMRAPALAQTGLLTLLQAVLLWILIEGEPERVRIAGLLTLAVLPPFLGMEYGLAILQGQGRFRAFNILRGVWVSVYGAVAVIIFAIGEAGLISITIAAITGVVASASVILFVALKGARPAGGTANPPGRRQIFRFGVKGYLGGLSPIDTFRLDMAAIGLFLSSSDLGLYVVALSFTNLPRFIALSVGAIAFPRAAHDDNGRRTMWRFTIFAAAMTAVVIVPLELAAGWLVPLFFGSDFAPSVDVTRILLVGAFFYSIRRVLADGAKGIGSPGLGSIAELGSWISLLPLLAILMPAFGLPGVAAAIAIASAFSLAILVLVLLWKPPVPRRQMITPQLETSFTVDGTLIDKTRDL